MFKIILIILLLFNVSCSNTLQHGMETTTDPLKFFHDTLPSYYSLVEFSLSERELSTIFFAQLNQQLKEQGHLDADSLQMLKIASKRHQQLRETLIGIAEQYEPWLKDNSIAMPARLQGIMLSLSAALTAFDNYLFVVHQFQQHTHLRHIANSADSAYILESQELLRAGLSYYSLHNYRVMKKAIKFYQKNIAQFSEKNEDIIFLKQLIEQSPHYHYLQKQTLFDLLAGKLRLYLSTTGDLFNWVGDESTHTMSQFFGNLAGLVATRKGLLFEQTTQQRSIQQGLKAGDILLEKTPFRLTDSLIPGYWGHAAIWVGSEKELTALGLWNDALLRPHHADIRAGKQIIEAVRSGVHLSPLSEFLNIDDLAVLRKVTLTDKAKRTVILNAVAQLGKAYDFNFDVETSERIVCSELIYMSYTQTTWLTEKTLGRYAISPNHIAQKTLEGTFSLKQLYYQGQQVKLPEKLWQKMLLDSVE
ncbi:MAG: Poxvirus G6 [Methylococcaceae bacterium]|nr:Poxvirus G6 [Methylococcaceae bacterium]